jgi:hypothetical protein
MVLRPPGTDIRLTVSLLGLPKELVCTESKSGGADDPRLDNVWETLGMCKDEYAISGMVLI